MSEGGGGVRARPITQTHWLTKRSVGLRSEMRTLRLGWLFMTVATLRMAEPELGRYATDASPVTLPGGVFGKYVRYPATRLCSSYAPLER